MRNLTKCHDCGRIYEVSNFHEDKKFRCSCGTTLKQTAPKGHDSRIIRCSNCGGPRDTSSENCGYCQSEFTLHERDLNTVCPHCYTRVSDHAKFCHSCAASLKSITMKPKDTEAPCPACGGNQKLQERLLGDKKIPFSECSRCAGMWLEWEAFQIACQSSLNRSPMQLSALKPKKNNHPQTGRIYRQCPHCSEVMNRVNYARYSGIIIDACVVNNHGLWFDFDELPSVLSWLHQGGKHDRRVTGDLSVVERINTLSELNPEQITVNKAQTPDDDIVYIIDEEIDLDSVLKKLFTK